MNDTLNRLRTITKAGIRDRNMSKTRTNLSKVSKYLHIEIFSYLSPKEIFKVCMISRCFMKASREPGVWETYFPDQKRLRRLIEEEKEAAAKKKIDPRSIKAMLMDELNVVANLT